jgi:hypothetical protein
MAIGTSDIHPGTQDELPVPAGEWAVDPVRSSASFTARVAGRSVRGRLPLSGGARISATPEESAACLVATTTALSTGSGLLDRMLVGSGFLEAEAFPEISFRSDMLVHVPSGWRAVGQLEVKGMRTRGGSSRPHDGHQPLGPRLSVGHQPAGSGTWPQHRDDLLGHAPTSRMKPSPVDPRAQV